MKSITIILKSIKNLLPYFLLIGIYFFFVNLEARKDTKNTLNSEEENIFTDDELSFDEKDLRIKIPVIPYYE